MLRVFVAQDPFEAHVVKDYLGSIGIEATVRGEYLFGIRGGVPLTEDTLPSVWLVYDEDLEPALSLIEKLKARQNLRPVEGSDAF